MAAPQKSTPALAGKFQHTVAADEAGLRLDQLLTRHVTDMSRSRLAALIRDGLVATRDRVIREPSYSVKPGERVECRFPEVREPTVEAEAIPLDILYEDDDLIVVNKPAGMVVHPSAGHQSGTLVHALLHHCGDSLSGIGGVQRPGIVHRLDQPVSGVMLAAKNDRAHRGLAAQFTVHAIERVYRALVSGLPSPTSGTIDAPIGRHPKDRLRQAVTEKGGKRAVTHYELIDAAGIGASLLDVRLETGRTHQIRVHLSHIGHPILGDPLYFRVRRKLPPDVAARLKALNRIMLHARILGFEHPLTGERLHFEVSPPRCFDEILASLKT